MRLDETPDAVSSCFAPADVGVVAALDAGAGADVAGVASAGAAGAVASTGVAGATTAVAAGCAGVVTLLAGIDVGDGSLSLVGEASVGCSGCDAAVAAAAAVIPRGGTAGGHGESASTDFGANAAVVIAEDEAGAAGIGAGEDAGLETVLTETFGPYPLATVFCCGVTIIWRASISPLRSKRAPTRPTYTPYFSYVLASLSRRPWLPRSPSLMNTEGADMASKADSAISSY